MCFTPSQFDFLIIVIFIYKWQLYSLQCDVISQDLFLINLFLFILTINVTLYLTIGTSFLTIFTLFISHNYKLLVTVATLFSQL